MEFKNAVDWATECSPSALDMYSLYRRPNYRYRYKNQDKLKYPEDKDGKSIGEVLREREKAHKTIVERISPDDAKKWEET